MGKQISCSLISPMCYCVCGEWEKWSAAGTFRRMALQSLATDSTEWVRWSWPWQSSVLAHCAAHAVLEHQSARRLSRLLLHWCNETQASTVRQSCCVMLSRIHLFVPYSIRASSRRHFSHRNERRKAVCRCAGLKCLLKVSECNDEIYNTEFKQVHYLIKHPLCSMVEYIIDTTIYKGNLQVTTSNFQVLMKHCPGTANVSLSGETAIFFFCNY